MKQGLKCLTVLVSIVSLFFTSTVVHSQTLNPSYLSEMPAPARVVAEIKGKDPADAGERQLGAFMILVTLISDMAYGLEHRFDRQLTPDEQRISTAYRTAYTEVWHKVKDTYGKQYMGDYDHDRDLRNEVLDKFFSANFKALFTKSNRQTATQLQAARDRANGNVSNNTSSNQPSTPGGGAPPSGGPGTTGEMNRCVASGRSMRRCFTEVMGNGFSQMLGGGINPNEPVPVPAGLRMTGDFAAANGFRVIFAPGFATLVCRGVPSPKPYSVELTNTAALVKIENGSSHVVLSMSPDGKLSGSGPIKVTGQVPAGSHTEQTSGMRTQQTTRTRELTPLEAGQYQGATQNGQTYTIREDASEMVYGPTGTRKVVDMVWKTTECSLGVLSPIGGSPLPVINQLDNPFAMLTTMGSGMMTLMKGGSAQDAAGEMLNPKSERAIAPGLRMHGKYASSTGFSLAFHEESVTLGCGDSERALEYTVQRSGDKTTLVARENGSPISFQLLPDGSVVGEGTVQVNGRVITGTTEDMDNPFTFAPHVARCEVGRLTAGSTPGNPPVATSVPTNSTSPVSSSPVPGSSQPPSSSPQVSSAPATVAPGGITLTIAAGPGVANLLAGKVLVVLKDSLENVLANAGVNAQGRSSRVSAWAHACEAGASDPLCQAGINAFRSYAVASTKLDGTGSTTFSNIPKTGTFYIVADTSKAHHLFWNVRVDLKPGSNSVRLDESNTTAVDR